MKSTIKATLLILLPSVMLLGISVAQGPRGGGGRPPHGPPRGLPGALIPGGDEEPSIPPIMDALDKDLDGSISKDELETAAESLKTLDKNNDGIITKDELKPERPAGAPADDDEEDKKSRRTPHVPPVIKVLDADEKGEISSEEIENATDS